MDRTLENMRRRLERWELGHLRQLAAELHERLERMEDRATRAEEEADRAWQAADAWQLHAMDLQRELIDAGGDAGITQDGQLLARGPGDE